MTFFALAFAQVALGQGPAPTPELDANPLYRTILKEGFVVGGVTVNLPPPCLREGMSKLERRAALETVVDRFPLEEFLRDSPYAQSMSRIRDVAYPDGVVYVVDLWFAVHADLDEIELDDLASKKDQAGKEGQAANMKFSARSLNDAELKAHAKVLNGDLDRFVLSKGRLLDKVELSTVNHVLGSKTVGALVVASMTDPAFPKDGELANRWVSIPDPGSARKVPGAPRPYEGSAGYTRISQYSEKPSILLVESHLAFAEPNGWFSRHGILSSKISLIAKEEIPKFRKEVIERRKKQGQPKAAKP